MFAPHSKGRQSTGVARVLSSAYTMPYFFAIFAIFSKSMILMAGLAIVSVKMSLVLSSMSFSISSAGASGSKKRVSMPNLGSVTAKRLNEPP